MKEDDLQHELAYLAKNKLIGKQLIDATDHYDALSHKQGISLFFIVSIIIHASIIAFVAYTYTTPELLDQQPSVETSLLTTQDLATLQKQIRENQKIASGTTSNAETTGSIKTINGNDDSADVSISSQGTPISELNTAPAQSVAKNDVVFTPSKQAQEMDAEIAEKNRQFTKALEAFTQKQDQKATSKLTDQDKELEEQRKKNLADVNELKDVEKQAAKIAKDNRDALQQAAADLKQRHEQDTESKATNNDLSSGKKTVQPKEKSTVPSGNAKVSSATHITAINVKIDGAFEAPDNTHGMTVTVTIYVDKRGNVKQVIVTNPSLSDALNKEAVRAVKKASPLPINPDDPDLYPSFDFPLKGKI